MDIIQVKRVEPILRDLIHNAIIDSVHFVVQKCDKLGNTPQEPDFVAALTLKFTNNLANILKALFLENKFSVTGIYCHQKPIVDINLSKDPELGDLLFVYVNTDKKGNKTFNSLLLQAKISQHISMVIPRYELHQLELYKKWPKFTYKRSGKLNGTTRDVIPKAINNGAQYLLIDNHPINGLLGLPDTFPMGCATPNEVLILNNDFATEIVEFIKFKSGRIFEENPSISKDDWTKMIWDLLEISKEKASSRRNAGINNFPRQSTGLFDGCCFFMTETDSYFRELHRKLQNGDYRNNIDEYSDENNSSTSVILIESYEERVE